MEQCPLSGSGAARHVARHAAVNGQRPISAARPMSSCELQLDGLVSLFFSTPCMQDTMLITYVQHPIRATAERGRLPRVTGKKSYRQRVSDPPSVVTTLLALGLVCLCVQQRVQLRGV